MRRRGAAGRWRMPGRRVVLRWLAGLALVVALAIWGLASGVGMGLLVPAALGWAAPDGWTVEVGEVEGDWRSRIRLRDVVMRGPSGTASVGELSVEYRLRSLLGRRVEITSVVLGEPRVRMELAAPGAEEPPRPDTASAPALDVLLGRSPLGAWSLELGELRVTDAAATLVGSRGAYAVSDGSLAGSVMLDSGNVVLAVDTLAARFTPPEGSATAGELRFAGSLHNGLVRVRELVLRSPRSRVAGAGEVALAGAHTPVDRLDFRLEADPLDLRDLPLELPDQVLADPLVKLDLTAAGVADSTLARATLAGPAGLRGDLSAVLRFAERAQAPSEHAALRLQAQLGGALAAFSSPPLDGNVAADFEVELARLDPRSEARARGTLVHEPLPGAPQGVLGRALRVSFEAARAPPEEDGSGAVMEVTATLQGAQTAGAPSPGSAWRDLGEVAARVVGERAEWRMSLAADSGAARGSGSVAWGGAAPRIVVDALALERLDLRALDEGFPLTAISGRLEADVTGAAIEDLAGDVALALAPSTLGETALDTLAVAATLTPGALAGSVLAALPGARLETSVDAVLRDSLVEASLPDLRLTLTPSDSAPEIAPDTASATAPDTAPDARRTGSETLEARASARATWALGPVRRATLDAELDTSAVAGLPVRSGSLRATLAGDTVGARLALELADVLSAPARVEATADVVGTSPQQMLGAVHLTATRTPPALPDSLEPAGAEPAPQDVLRLDVTAAEPGRFVVDAELLPAEGGRAQLDGEALASAEGYAFELTGSGSLDVPAQLLRGATLDTLTLQASGETGSEGVRALHVELAAGGAEWRELTAHSLRVVLGADGAELRLDTLGLESDVLTLSGAGALPFRSEASGQVDFAAVFDLEPLRDVVEADLPVIGSNEVTARLSGALDSLEVSADVRMSALASGEVRIAGFDVDGRALLRPPFDALGGLRRTETSIELDRILLPHAEVGSVTVSIEGGPDSLHVAATALVDEGRQGELEATLDPRPEARRVRFDRLELQLDEDRWQMQGGPAVLSYLDGFALRSFQLVAGEQAIAVDGGVAGDGTLDLALAMDSTDVGTVADLLGLPLLDGWLGGTAQLTGTTAAPSGTVDLSAGFGLEDARPVLVSLVAEADGSAATLDLDLADPSGGRIGVDGTVAFAGGGARGLGSGAAGAEQAGTGELALTVDASRMPVDHFRSFLDPTQVTALGGLLDASLTVSGPFEAIRVEGPVSLSQGTARAAALGVTWEDVRVQARGEGTALVIDSGYVAAGPGTMTFAGRIELEEARALDLGAYFDGFQAIATNAYQAVVSGELHAGGTLTEPVVEGEMRVESLDAWLDELSPASGLEDVELTEEDLATLRERFGYIVVEEDLEPARTQLLTADLSVEIGRDSWLRRRAGPEMAVAFSGDVEVRLRPGFEPNVVGTLTIIERRGYVSQFGKRFEMREGTVTLDGPPSSAQLDLAASYTVPSHSNPDEAEATIVLAIQGTQEELSLELSSEPPMENADIVSYIATGRPAASHLAIGDGGGAGGGGGGGGGLASAGADIAIGQLAGAVQAATQRGVGLDVIEIRSEGVRGATLVAGKYLSPRLYLGFAQPVMQRGSGGASLGRESESEIEVELELLRGLLLNLEGSGSSLRTFLRGRRAY